MYWFLIISCIIFHCDAAVVTYPSNPNYYKYAPDENGTFYVKTKSDRKVEERITKALLRRLVSGYEGQIKFDVSQGNVTLNGFVGSKWDKDEIENRVRRVEGVHSINNQITIQGSSNQ